MQSLLIYALIGGGIGALLGYFGKCNLGACRLAASWQRGALSGTGLAVAFCLLTGCGESAAKMNASTPNVTHITQEQFDAEVMQAKLPVVVDCYATWCGPCRQLAPIVDGLADKYAGKIKFVKVNVDEAPMVAKKFNVQGIPMLLYFKNAKLLNTSVGLLSKEDLVMQLETLLQATTNAPPTTPTSAPIPAPAPGV